MARKITYQQAINEALAQEMERDETVVLMGEDIAGGMGAPRRGRRLGRRARRHQGPLPPLPGRVLDTPISESAYVGAAAGAAASGLRPVAELMFVDFLGVCFDQIFNQAAKFRYMFGGKPKTPMVIRTMCGAGIRAASQHSQSLYPIFTHIPGLKVVVPSTPYDAKGLLIQAIRDDDPVIFFEHKVLYTTEGDVPEEPYAIPFGEANIMREGDDVTIVALGRMVWMAPGGGRRSSRARGSPARSSTRARRRRSTRRRSSRAWRTPAGWSSSTRPTRAAGSRPTSSRIVAQAAFGDLKAAPQMVTAAAHARCPSAPVLEDAYVPTPEAIAAAGARGGGRRRAGMTDDDAEARHAEVGPVDDRGHVRRVARRRGRRGRGRRRGRRGRDREDQRRGREPGGRRAAPARGRRRRDGRRSAALLGVVAPRRGRGRGRSTPSSRSSRRRSCRARPRRTPAARARDRPGRAGHAALPAPGRRRRGGACSCTASGATSTTGCSRRRRWPQGHTVYALDLPGHGGSSKDVGPATSTSSSMPCSDVPRLRSTGGVHLVGHSLGGLVAGEHGAARIPDRARSLALVATARLRRARSTATTSTGSSRAGRGASSSPCCELLFADPGQVTRQLVEDVLQYKRLDGVDEALRAIADARFATGASTCSSADRLGRPRRAAARPLGRGGPHHPGRARPARRLHAREVLLEGTATRRTWRRRATSTA